MNTDSIEVGENSDYKAIGDKTEQQNYGKAAILTRSITYIQHLETTTQRLGNEALLLNTRVVAFERLAIAGSIATNSVTALNRPLAPRTETLQTIRAGMFLFGLSFRISS
jgi:hypothetical protein